MKERPILFSAPMVRALLDGRKTQTRRVVKPQPPTTEAVRKLAGIDYSWISPDRPGIEYHRPAGPVWAVRKLMGVEPEIRCPYGQPGDRLWVREAWRATKVADELKPSQLAGGSGSPVWYEAQDLVPFHPSGFGKLRPSMFMPRWASRITLEITRVQVERLENFSEADAMAEGIATVVFRPVTGWPLCNGFMAGPDHGYTCLATSAVRAYRGLWESINGPGSWDANPWVWVIEFKVLKGGGA